MTQYMLMFSLGPVQTFIEQARKTRDLWLGSYLLSKLIEAAMEEVEQAVPGARFVFPTERKVSRDISDLPNKYIAIFKKLEEAEEAATISEKQVKQRWKVITTAVWKGIVEGHDTAETRAIWGRQTNPETLFEIFWVIVEGDPAAYGNWLERTQAALDARKRLRDFMLPYTPEQPDARGEPGEKSSVSGEREVLRGSGTTRDSMLAFWKSLSAPLSAKDISKDGTERLDAIDMVKRFATRAEEYIPSKPFPSTSYIATAAYVRMLDRTVLNPSVLKALEAWLNVTEAKDIDKVSPDTLPYFAQRKGERRPIMQRVLQRDGDCFFQETFTPERLKKDYNLTDDKKAERVFIAEKAPKALTALLRATDALTPPIPRPTSYYAIVQMDGDNMGTLLSGVADQNEHQKISEALSNFARKEVSSIVQRDRPGYLVYAGGDDVLALSPLDGLLDFVDLLQQLYCAKIKPSVNGEKRKQSVTASTGIAISHHFTSLSYVLRTVREAEKLAKDRYGKNAFVVTVLRRSGEQTRVGCGWRYEGLDDAGQPVRLFTRFFELLDQDILSPQCVHNMLAEAPTLIGLDEEAQKSEIKRILKRQRDDKKKSHLPDDQVEELARHLVELATAMDEVTDELHKYDRQFEKSIYLHEDKPRYGLIETLGWLLVMAFLAKKEQD